MSIMLTDWIHWLSLLTYDELLLIVLPLICFDTLRYCLASVMMCLWDSSIDFYCQLRGIQRESQPANYPSVCVVLAGLNEAETVGATLASVWNSYPRLEIIVVDDGSSDGMSAVARSYAETHENVLVLRKPCRGGKSSALNFALSFTNAEIIVCVDTDSHLQPDAIFKIVQPFIDPKVGAVAGTLLARNAHANLASELQAAEYLRSIFIGRMILSRLGILGIVSGAFGAFRREAIIRTKGWDVGPGEDGDLVLRLRKAGWKIEHAAYAQCMTNVPISWRRLFKQRRRWEWSVITFECRKHVDMANCFSPNFRLSNLMMLLETWVFRIFLTFALPVGLVWMTMRDVRLLGFILLTNYVFYLSIELIQWIVLLYYSPAPRRDAWSIACFPFVPAYYLFLKVASIVAIIEELLWRRSYDDDFVPLHIRQTTWHW